MIQIVQEPICDHPHPLMRSDYSDRKHRGKSVPPFTTLKATLHCPVTERTQGEQETSAAGARGLELSLSLKSLTQ